MESPITPVPLTRHQTTTSLYQGCSQKTLAPLATFLSRYRGVVTSNLQGAPARRQRSLC